MKEVWCLSSRYDASPAPPEQFQAVVAFTINRSFAHSKGHFRPWAVLTVPEFGRAFRFVYPTLVVVCFETAYLYNVLSCELSQTIPDIQVAINGKNLGGINYVELGPQYVFICGSIQLRIFDRTSGALVYCISSTEKRIVNGAITVHRSPEIFSQGAPIRVDKLRRDPGTPQSSTLSVPEFVGGKFDQVGTVVFQLVDCILLTSSACEQRW